MEFAELASPWTSSSRSNGASDYGNKLGEPVICGFARSFTLTLLSERREGCRSCSAGLARRAPPTPTRGARARMGGEARRPRVPHRGGRRRRVVARRRRALGGARLDAVQRGDAEMENKMNA